MDENELEELVEFWLSAAYTRYDTDHGPTGTIEGHFLDLIREGGFKIVKVQ